MKRNNTDVLSMIVVLFVIILFKIIPFISSDQMLEMVQKDGIPIECHYVTTEDGYILRLYHILPSLNTSIDRTSLKPMLFMHGLQSSSLDFVFYSNSSAGQYFHHHGYDIWLGNARGNTFSRNHTTVDPDDAKFWKFSWHEIGVHDLPAIIDYVLDKTQQEQLIYTGYSQGGSIMFVLLSERPEYNKKISSIHLLAGAVYYTCSSAILNPLLNNINTLKTIIEDINLFEVNSYEGSSTIVRFFGELCTMRAFTDICQLFIGNIFGPFAPTSYYDNLLLDYSSINPSGASYRQFIHYLQMFKSGRFQRYDHGRSRNKKLYNSPAPPIYNLTNVQNKIHLMFGSNDNLVSPKSTSILAKKLKHCEVILDEMDTFNHLDFVMGKRVHTLNPVMLRAITKFT